MPNRGRCSIPPSSRTHARRAFRFSKGGKEIKAGLDAISTIGEMYPNLRFILSQDALLTNMKNMQRMTKHGHDSILPVKNNRTKLWRETFKAVQGDYDQYCNSTEKLQGHSPAKSQRLV